MKNHSDADRRYMYVHDLVQCDGVLSARQR